MSVERAKRNIKPPQKFADDDELWSKAKQEPSEEPVKYVYRLLNRKDVNKDLYVTAIHLLWPDNGVWYEAEVKKLRIKDLKADVEYTETDEKEEVDLAQLILDRQIAFREERPLSHKCTQDEVEAPEEPEPGAAPEGEGGNDGEEGSEHAEMSEEEPDAGAISDHEDDDASMEDVPSEATKDSTSDEEAVGGAEGAEQAAPVAGSPLKAGARAGAKRLSANDLHHSGDHAAKRAKPSPSSKFGGRQLSSKARELLEAHHRAAAAALAGSAPTPAARIGPVTTNGSLGVPGGRGSGTEAGGGVGEAGEEDKYSAAEAEAQAMLAKVKARRAAQLQAARPATDHRPAAKPEARVLHRVKSDTSSGSAPPLARNTSFTSEKEAEMRKVVRENIQSALKMATEEVTKEGFEGQLPDPVALGNNIEEALYKLHGGANKDYKAKYRSLWFNLKDPNNPDLRARVLHGEVDPPTLVRMSANELASRELSQWRQKKAEESLQASVLDEEAAAKFSTAAAMAAGMRSRQHFKDENSTRMDLLTSSPSREAPHGEQASTDLGHRSTSLDGTERAQHVQHVDETKQLGELPDAPPPPPGSPPADPAAADTKPSPKAEPEADTGAANGGVDEPGPGSAADAPKLEAGAEAERPDQDQLKPEPEGKPEGQAEAAAPAALSAAAASITSIKKDGSVPASPKAGGIDWASIKAQTMQARRKEAADTPMFQDFGEFQAQADSPVAQAGAAAAAAAADVDDHTYSPPAATEAEEAKGASVADLAPLMAPSSGLQPQTWKGRLHYPGQGRYNAVADDLAGPVSMSKFGLGRELDVKGRMGCDKLEEYLEELRHSRSRTVSVGLLRAASGDDAAHFVKLADNYARKQRSSVLETGSPHLEAHVVPQCSVADRLLTTARQAAAPAARDTLPAALGDDRLLLVIVHRKDWQPVERSSHHHRSSGSLKSPDNHKASPHHPPPFAPESPKDDAAGSSAAQQAQQDGDAGQHLQLPPPSGEPVDQAVISAGSAPQQAQLQAISDLINPLVDPRTAAAQQPPAGTPAATAASIASTVEGMSSLPAGLDLSSISALAAALGIPSVTLDEAAPQTSQPQVDGLGSSGPMAALPDPRDPRARDPRAGGAPEPHRDLRMARVAQGDVAQSPLQHPSPGSAPYPKPQQASGLGPGPGPGSGQGGRYSGGGRGRWQPEPGRGYRGGGGGDRGRGVQLTV
ncbi:hypothetical protein WJX72_000989 [[Myrmecia] bisecta]|uniref:TFIIS central domain-containing protein n=1 Tax=[Myrmecia] bisecta TaxID=41462 RepID=A0AAW1R5N9_9CHLO